MAGLQVCLGSIWNLLLAKQMYVPSFRTVYKSWCRSSSTPWSRSIKQLQVNKAKLTTVTQAYVIVISLPALPLMISHAQSSVLLLISSLTSIDLVG